MVKSEYDQEVPEEGVEEQEEGEMEAGNGLVEEEKNWRERGGEERMEMRRRTVCKWISWKMNEVKFGSHGTCRRLGFITDDSIV
eukprot:Nk52_evm5s726 gene=Nk52_evmTU5s726